MWVLSHYACLNCRYAAKGQTVCPHCRGEMVCLGTRFKPPRRSARKQWAKVALLVDHGFPGHRCDTCWSPSRIPAFRTYADVKSHWNLRRKRKAYAHV